MQDKGLMRIYTELPTWAKGILVVGGGVAIYFGANALLKKLKEDKLKKEAEQDLTNASDELSNLSKTGVVPTISKTTADAIANAIVQASNDCGSDEKLVYAQFDKIKNQADILLLIKSFGLRQKVRCPFSNDPRESFFSANTPPMSLSAMLNSELSASELETLNNKLATKGIQYKF